MRVEAESKTRPTGVRWSRVVVGEGLDNHPGPIGYERAQHAEGGACRVAHVVQASRRRRPGRRRCRGYSSAEGDLEADPVGDPAASLRAASMEGWR
jgi:hypothetical protein